MSRKPRFILPGIAQHVIQRGNNREPCFYAEQDYWRYLHDLKEAATHNQAAIHAYVLMTDHVHMLARRRLRPTSHEVAPVGHQK
jgi:putative transposase